MVELVIWDKDFVLKEYLGVVAVFLEDWFADGWSFDGRSGLMIWEQGAFDPRVSLKLLY